MKKMKWLALLTAVLCLFSALALADAPAEELIPEVVSKKIQAVIANESGAAIYGAMDESGELATKAFGETVEVQTLGLGWCRLRDAEAKLYVRTKDLNFSGEDTDSQLAIVFLKRSKQLPLHKTASASSKTLTKVDDGSYVVVLEKGETFSHVLYGRYDGYLQNSYLSFRSAWQGDVARGTIRDPDRPKRKTTINLRSSDSKNGKKVRTLATLQDVTVLQIKGEWAEIESDKGIHGYMLVEWLELPEGLTRTAPAGSDEPVTPAVASAVFVDSQPEAPVDEEADDGAEEEALTPEWEDDEPAAE